MNLALAMALALAIDLYVGWPDWLFRRIGHPVTWMGKAIQVCDRYLNRGGHLRRRWSGAVAVIVLLGLTALFAWIIQAGAAQAAQPLDTLLLGIAAWPLVAARSLQTHVQQVEIPLSVHDLPAARASLGLIVGRDIGQLDEPAVARAALESLAENTSDGVVAPLFWGALLGLPGIAAYKAINTADSMIGHRDARYADFGWFAARLDDLVNLLPARLTALTILLAGARTLAAVKAVWRDAEKHRSPNAGWPEASMAVALGCRLSGPRSYYGGVSMEPWLNATAPDPRAGDMVRGLRIYRKVLLLFAAALAVAGLATA